MKTEILILGGGPAGLAAAIYAARAGRKTLVLEGRGASRLSVGYQVENYPGFLSIESRELQEKFKTHAEHFGAEIMTSDAIDFNLSTDPKYVVTRDLLIETHALIIATGKPFSKTKMIPGEERLLGAGVSYCSTCDGPLYRGQKVGAFGISNEAAEDILALEQMGIEVHWIPGEGQDLEISSQMTEEIHKKRIALYSKAGIKEIVGEKRVEKLIITREGKEEDLAVSAVFIFREVPTAALFAKAGLNLDHKQCIAVDRFQRTNLDGVFAAGDVTCGGMQIVSAAGEGAVAAMQAIIFLRKKAS